MMTSPFKNVEAADFEAREFAENRPMGRAEV